MLFNFQDQYKDAYISNNHDRNVEPLHTIPPLQYQMGACKHDLHWLCWDVMTMSLLTAMYIHYDVYKTTVHVLRIS